MQTNYKQYMGKAYAGMIADVQFQNNIVSRVLESATIYPGLIVSRGTDKERQVVVGGAAAIGAVVRSLDAENNAANELQYAAKDTLGIMVAGVIWVELANTGSPGDAICYATATGIVSAGAPGGGQVALNGRLDSEVTANGDLARIVLIDPAAAITYVPVVPVSITTQPIDTSAADGAVATFTVVASGDATITYQWDESTDGTSWTEMSGEDAATLDFTVATGDNGNKYRCNVTNDYGTKVSDVATLTVT